MTKGDQIAALRCMIIFSRIHAMPVMLMQHPLIENTCLKNNQM
jgi:hypothetical protein